MTVATVGGMRAGKRATLEERSCKKADDLGVGIPRFELPVRSTATNDSGEIHSFFFLCLLDFACTLFRHCIMHEDKVFS